MRLSPCHSCESAIDHCHGTLIVHLARRPECTEDICLDFDHTRHTFIVDCVDLAGGCPCAHATSSSRTAELP
ncbi:hypothetical protein [Nocardia sp. XZ_19_385]|uniref:hypothetical protein n=1 Tax=Nocardia sp. XZ_19_385 TaxID=2769488 RepID=UPI00188F189D|nr:hypothetical protein [Nocardia sp. XZ_19_385]